MNNVTLKGKIVSDITLRRSKQEISVADFRVMYKNRKTRHPLYIDVEVWGKEAERLHESAQRGSHIIVYGELRRDVWEKDGEERTKIKITARQTLLVAFIGSRPDTETAAEEVDAESEDPELPEEDNSF